jgi:hypothetical protein
VTTNNTSETAIVTFKMSVGDKAEMEMLAATRERTLSAELRLAVRAHLAKARAKVPA